MGPGGPLRPGPAPSAYLRLPSEAAAAAAAAEVEAVGLGAQARCGSYPRRSTRMEKAGEDAQGHFVATLLVTSRGRQGQAGGAVKMKRTSTLKTDCTNRLDTVTDDEDTFLVFVAIAD